MALDVRHRGIARTGLHNIAAHKSPKPAMLVAQGRDDEARNVLISMGGKSSDAGKELAAIRASLVETRKHLTERFFQPKYLKPILMAVAIAAFNQLSGINALIYYTRRIFEMAGASGTSALLQACDYWQC